MEALVTYDVETTTPEGHKRLRQVARACEGYGQRVQLSVFEVQCSDTKFSELLAALESLIDVKTDNLRIYRLPSGSLDDAIAFGRRRGFAPADAWVI